MILSQCVFVSIRVNMGLTLSMLRIDFFWYRLKARNLISHVLNEQGTGYEHIFSSVQTFNID